jgi:Nucleoside-diphosphate-sugar epimerases
VARTAQDKGRTFAVNLGGSLNLALAMARHVPKAMLLFASSSEVYGASFLRGVVTEATPSLPVNDYAKSKHLAEEMFAEVLPPEGRLVIARPFNHTGVGQREDFVLPSFAGQIARIEAGRQEPRMAVGNLDVVRDFLDVRDVVDAYIALIDATPRLPQRFTCNIASGNAVALRNRLETMQAMSRTPFEICVDPTRMRRVDVPVAAGDATLLQSVTNWAPRRTITDTLQALLDAARAAVPTS